MLTGLQRAVIRMAATQEALLKKEKIRQKHAKRSEALRQKQDEKRAEKLAEMKVEEETKKYFQWIEKTRGVKTSGKYLLMTHKRKLAKMAQQREALENL